MSTNLERLHETIWTNTDLDLTATQTVAKALDQAGVTAPEETK